MSKCPVCVFTSSNMPAADLAGLKCWNCGRRYVDHPVQRSADIAPGLTYAYEVFDAVTRPTLEAS